MHGQANIGEGILDFGAFVKAEAADQFVAQTAAAERFFERARLEVGAIFDDAGLIGIVIEQLLQFLSDKFGFGLRVARFEVAKIGSGGLFGAKSLAQAIGIIFYDRAGCVQDALRGAVVAFETNDFGLGKIVREAEENRDIRSAPAVQGLRRV